MRWNVLFVAAAFLVAASLPSAAQIRMDMNKITCGGWFGYGPEERDFVRFCMSGYYNAAASSTILDYDRFQQNSAKVATTARATSPKPYRPQSRTLACGGEQVDCITRQTIGKRPVMTMEISY